MPLPVIFANLTNPTLPELDQNFAALGALTPIPCAVSGTNALTLAPLSTAPTVNAYSGNQSFLGVISATNTNAVSAQVGALAALQVYKDTALGPQALSGGELVPNNLLTLTYDGALNGGAGGFHLATSASANPGAVVGSSRGLKGSAAGGTQTASWSVIEFIAEGALGGLTVKGVNLALSFNGGTVGAGGMDTGTVPATSSLAVYAIYNPTTSTWSTLGQATGSAVPSLVYSGTHMPSGYLYSALIWTGVSDGSSNVKKFNQLDRTVYTGQIVAVNATAGTANTYATASISSLVPFGASTVSGTAGSTSVSAASQVTVASDTSGNWSQPIVTGNSTVALDGFGSAAPFVALPLTTAQQIAWKAGTNTVNTTINVDRYMF